MTYLAVFEKVPGVDGTGGNRIIMSYEDIRDAQQGALALAGRFTLVAQNVTTDEANKLCCMAPDICVVIGTLDEMFNPTGRLVLNNNIVDSAVSKAILGVKVNHEYQKKYGVTPTGILPENLKNLGSHMAKDSDKIHFTKSLCFAYPTGIIEDEQDLPDFLDGLVRQTCRRGHP